MVCPFCLHKKSSTYNSRSTAKGMAVWRRHRCLACGKSFTTREFFDPTGIWNVKALKKTVPYNRAKLTMSLLRACDHRTNQDSAAWYLFEAVEQQLYPIAAKKLHTVTAADIFNTAAAVLKHFDATAYVKYISYHRPAMDATTLRRYLRKS